MCSVDQVDLVFKLNDVWIFGRSYLSSCFSCFKMTTSNLTSSTFNSLSLIYLFPIHSLCLYDVFLPVEVGLKHTHQSYCTSSRSVGHSDVAFLADGYKLILKLQLHAIRSHVFQRRENKGKHYLQCLLFSTHCRRTWGNQCWPFWCRWSLAQSPSRCFQTSSGGCDWVWCTAQGNGPASETTGMCSFVFCLSVVRFICPKCQHR